MKGGNPTRWSEEGRMLLIAARVVKPSAEQVAHSQSFVFCDRGCGKILP